ncbi:MAG: L,D-transpeptidase family protein [Alphaproteobacteria bacterium]|nr:L,D-transpeptidase family protein [Alphaproteobacteria bacterium]
MDDIAISRERCRSDRRELARRALFLLALPVGVAGLSAAAQIRHENLEYHGGRLHWSRGSATAAVGRAGVKAGKHEGDGATPSGTYPLVSVYYRADRIPSPESKLPVSRLAPDDGWVDEPGDPRYNRLVRLPYPAGTEKMWRRDELYDLLVVIGYNMEPVVPGAGSAIFLHTATPDFTPTAGCVAVGREVLLGLVPLLGPGSSITIRA